MLLAGYYARCLVKDLKGEKYNKNWLLVRIILEDIAIIALVILALCAT